MSRLLVMFMLTITAVFVLGCTHPQGYNNHMGPAGADKIKAGNTSFDDRGGRSLHRSGRGFSRGGGHHHR